MNQIFRFETDIDVYAYDIFEAKDKIDSLRKLNDLKKLQIKISLLCVKPVEEKELGVNQ